MTAGAENYDAGRFVELLGGHWPDLSPSDAQPLGDLLSELWVAATQTWPRVPLSPAVFVAHLVRHLPAGGDLRPCLEALRGTDLYLACACLAGHPAALRAFEDHCLTGLRRLLERISPGAAEDVQQSLKQTLLCGSSPKLAEFRGRGDLRAWVRVSAIRLAMKVQRKQVRELALDDAALAELAVPQDDENAYFKRAYQIELETAFRQAFAALSDRERNLLRNQLLDGLSIDEIGKLHAVHRATAARRLERIRGKLEVDTRAALRERLEVSDEDLDSMLRLVVSGFDGSLRQMLRSEEPDDLDDQATGNLRQ